MGSVFGKDTLDVALQVTGTQITIMSTSEEFVCKSVQTVATLLLLQKGRVILKESKYSTLYTTVILSVATPQQSQVFVYSVASLFKVSCYPRRFYSHLYMSCIYQTSFTSIIRNASSLTYNSALLDIGFFQLTAQIVFIMVSLVGWCSGLLIPYWPEGLV